MKKGKLKKILATGAMGIMALIIPFAFAGCDKEKTSQPDSTIESFNVTFDYNFDYDITLMFNNFKNEQKINKDEWITNLPEIKSIYQDYFDGWYIKDSNKEIENYDFIGGDVSLIARWNKKPYGIYDDGVLVASLEDVLNNQDDNKIYNGTLVTNAIESRIKGSISNIYLTDDVHNITAIGNKGLKSLEVSLNNEHYSSVDGVLYNKSLDKLIYYPQSKEGESLTFLPSIRCIDKFAFKDNENLERITFSDLTETINGNCSSPTKKLKEFIVPSSNTSFKSVDVLTTSSNFSFKSVASFIISS